MVPLGVYNTLCVFQSSRSRSLNKITNLKPVRHHRLHIGMIPRGIIDKLHVAWVQFDTENFRRKHKSTLILSAVGILDKGFSSKLKL